MATKTYYTSRLAGFVHRLDDFTLPWVDVSVGAADDGFLDIMAVPGDPDRVIAVGRERQIYYSNDAGATWNQSAGDYTLLPGVDGTWEFKEIWIVDDLVSYVVGPQGVVLRSGDGGVTFNQTGTFPTPGGGLDGDVSAESVHFTSATTGVVGVALGGQSSVWKTTDSGATWTQLNGAAIFGGTSIPGINMTADQGQIIALTNTGIWRSTNNGVSFNLVQALNANVPSGEGLHLTWIAGENELWVTGLGDSVWKTTNYGATWNVIRGYGVGGAQSILAGHFFDSNNGFLGRGNEIHTTTDAGVTTAPSEAIIAPNAIWTEGSNPPPFCFILRSCDTNSYPDITDVVGDVGVDLMLVVGQVISTLDELGVERCFTVELQEDPCVEPPNLTVLAYTIVGSDCADFNIETCPTEIPLTIVGETSQVQVTVNNTSADAHDFTFALSACATGDLNILTASPLNIPGGGSDVIEFEYTPTQVENGSCTLTVTGPCGDIVCQICYSSVAVPSCPHFNICITGPSCAPDCIRPGEIIQFDLGGTISPVAYPTIVTFQLVNQATQEIVFAADYPVADDTELQAIVVNVIAPAPGAYCAEVCLPGCNTKRVLCFDVCQPFDIYKDECNKWHVHRPWQCPIEEYNVCIYELGSGNDPIVQDVIWDISQDNTFEFEVPHDGIYIFEMKDPETGEVIYSFSAFETCALQECFKIMMDKIMCSCADPCCKKCDGTPEQEREFARMSLNKLVPLYMTYLGMAHRDRLYSEGLQLINDDHMCFLHDASQILAKINDIIMDCGCLCPEQKNTATNRGDCLSC